MKGTELFDALIDSLADDFHKQAEFQDLPIGELRLAIIGLVKKGCLTVNVEKDGFRWNLTPECREALERGREGESA